MPGAQRGVHMSRWTPWVVDSNLSATTPTTSDRSQTRSTCRNGYPTTIRLADLLTQSDDDAFRPADVREPIGVPVLHHFAYQLGPVGEQASDHGVDVFDREHDATNAQRVHRRVHRP